MTDDGRILVFGSLALVAATGIARKGSGAILPDGRRYDRDDRYWIEMEIMSWSCENRRWLLNSESTFATAQTRKQARLVFHRAIKFCQAIRDRHPFWSQFRRHERHPAKEPSYEVFIRILDVSSVYPQQMSPKSYSVLQSHFLGGYEAQEDAYTLRDEIVERWNHQRISFRTFVPGEAP